MHLILAKYFLDWAQFVVEASQQTQTGQLVAPKYPRVILKTFVVIPELYISVGKAVDLSLDVLQRQSTGTFLLRLIDVNYVRFASSCLALVGHLVSSQHYL